MKFYDIRVTTKEGVKIDAGTVRADKYEIVDNDLYKTFNLYVSDEQIYCIVAESVEVLDPERNFIKVNINK